jgi:lysyl-tRNA synthetase class I
MRIRMHGESTPGDKTMKIPFSVLATLDLALDDHEAEFHAKHEAFGDYTSEDIDAFETEVAEARAWLESLEGYAPDGELSR